MPNARLGAFIDGASTGKLMNFPISTGLSNLISWRCIDIDLAAPYCDSTHSYGFRFLTTCTVSLISRPRWTESRRTVTTVTTNSMVSCKINNLQFINRFISSKDGFIDNEEPLDPAPLPYTPWRALDRNVPDADKKYTSSRA